MFARQPAWVMPNNPKYDMFFAERKFKGTTLWNGSYAAAGSRTPLSCLSYTNSGIAANLLYVQWKDGIVRPAGLSSESYMPRISDYGLWMEGDTGNRNNYAKFCRTFTDATWTLIGITAAKTSVGADGVSNAACRLTCTNSVNSALQTLTLTSKAVTTSAWVRRVTGTGTVNLSSDNVTWTDISGLINSSTYTQVRVPTQTLTNPSVGVQFGTSGDAIDIDFFQTENGDQATSPIVTPAGTVTTAGPEMSAFNTNGSVPNMGINIIRDTDFGTPYTILIQYSGNFSTSAGHALLISGGGTNALNFQGGTGASPVSASVGGLSVATANSDISGLFTLNKAIFRCDGSGGAICLNGGAIAKSSSVIPLTSFSGTTHVGIGSNGSNTIPLNGYIKRITIWLKALKDGELIQYSTIINNN